MRKEVVWAIVAGIVLGLVVAFGVYRINSTISSKKTTAGNRPTPSPTPSTPQEFKVVLDQPEDDDVLTQNSVNVTGITKSLAFVTFSGEDGDFLVQADNSGAFSQSVDLVPGINQIKVTAFDPSGNQNASEVLVVYSSSFQDETSPTSSPSASATSSASISAEVAREVTNTLNRPKAYIGTVTDITDSSIEIKNGASDIQQISIGAGTTSVVDSVSTPTKNVKTTDIAIGDSVVAMGYVGQSSVLGAQRILITTPVTEPKITISEAIVGSIAKKVLSVTKVPDGSGDSVQPDSKTDIETFKTGSTNPSKLSAIAQGNIIIYVETTDDKGNSSVRSIFVLPQSQ